MSHASDVCLTTLIELPIDSLNRLRSSTPVTAAEPSRFFLFRYSRESTDRVEFSIRIPFSSLSVFILKTSIRREYRDDWLHISRVTRSNRAEMNGNWQLCGRDNIHRLLFLLAMFLASPPPHKHEAKCNNNEM